MYETFLIKNSALMIYFTLHTFKMQQFINSNNHFTNERKKTEATFT